MGYNLWKISINENVITSTLFISNTIHLYAKKDNVYMYSFALLYGSSVLYHGTYNKIAYILDKIMVYNIIYQGGYRALVTNDYNSLTLGTVSCLMMTLYSYYFKLNKINSIRNHSYIHLFSSIGHHMIILNMIPTIM